MNVNTSNMDLVFIGDANWDIYADKNGKLFAIAKYDNCHDSAFGDKNHIKKLMANGWFNDEPTEKGLALINGLHSRLHVDSKGKRFSVLSFN